MEGDPELIHCAVECTQRFVMEEDEEDERDELLQENDTTSASVLLEPCQSSSPHLAYGSPIGTFQTRHERQCEHDRARRVGPWHPFEDQDEWELAKWLIESGLSQSEIENFLKLNVVSTWLLMTVQQQRLTGIKDTEKDYPIIWVQIHVLHTH
jgi:hypothetical protein